MMAGVSNPHTATWNVEECYAEKSDAVVGSSDAVWQFGVIAPSLGKQWLTSMSAISILKDPEDYYYSFFLICNPISPKTGAKFVTTGDKTHPPYNRLYEMQPLKYRSGKNEEACQQSWPQLLWTLVGSAWVCCLHQRNRQNQISWLATNGGWRMGCHLTAVCDQTGNQREEEVPGFSGWVWVFI